MADFINFLTPITTGAPNSAIITEDRVKAEPVEGILGGSRGPKPPTKGQLWPLPWLRN